MTISPIKKVGGRKIQITGIAAATGPGEVAGIPTEVIGYELLQPKLTVPVPAQATAGSVSSTVLCEAPFVGVVAAVSIVPNATITGVATNNRKFALVNKGQTGVGTTEIASVTFASGTNATGFDRKNLTLSVVSGALNVAVGDVLAVVETVNGTGLAHAGLLAQIEVTAT